MPRILRHFKRATGWKALINTSFNAHEEPIINRPEECLNALLGDRIDFVVTNGGVYELRRENAPSSSEAPRRRRTGLLSDREVFGLRMVHDDGGGRLLRFELIAFAERDADAIRAEQSREADADRRDWGRRDSRTNSVTRDNLARAARRYRARRRRRSRVRHALFCGRIRQRLGHFDAEAVQVEIILIAVLGEPLTRHFRRRVAHGDNLKADHVALVGRHVAEEVGDA